jgi:hypothetical protein
VNGAELAAQASDSPGRNDGHCRSVRRGDAVRKRNGLRYCR